MWTVEPLGPTITSSPHATVPVSVVIPAHNAETWLARAVGSVLVDAEEIVIVDDGSTDGTPEVAHAMAEKEPSITFARLPVNLGAAGARREAVRLARNEWIAPLDSDDYVGPHAVSSAFQQAQATDSDICIWTMYRVQEGVPIRWPDMSDLSFPMTGRQAARLTLGSWRIHPSGVIRKEIFERAAASVSVESYNSDELVTRSLFLEARMVTSCSAGYYYVDNPKSTTRASPPDVAGLARSQAWLLHFARANGFMSQDAALAHTMVSHGLALAEQVQRRGSLDDLTTLLDLLSECSIPLRLVGVRELVRTLRGRGLKQRIRALRNPPVSTTERTTP